MKIVDVLSELFTKHAEAGLEVTPQCIAHLAEEYPEYADDLKLFAMFFAQFKAASEEFSKNSKSLTDILLRLSDDTLVDDVNER
jgi:siderophore synthetase component